MENSEFLIKELNGLKALLEQEIEGCERPIQKRIWTDVANNLGELTQGYQKLKSDNNLYADYWIASVCAGINMYFSYLDMDWMTSIQGIKEPSDALSFKAANSLNTLLSTTDIIAKPCGQHEDGACVIGLMTPRCQSAVDSIPKGDIQNFSSPPKLILLPRGTQLYRIIELNGRKDGPWWFRNTMPSNITQWRSHYAVLCEWNKNGYYVEHAVVKENFKVWAGPAASQHVYWSIKIAGSKLKFYPNTNCILPGGHEQLWLDCSLIPNNVTPLKTGW